MTQTTLMERPRACAHPGCIEGLVYVTDPNCRHGGQNCECGVVELPCARCDGSGVEACELEAEDQRQERELVA